MNMEQVAFVNTVNQLVEAVVKGVAHIVLQTHIKLPPSLPLGVQGPTLSIQGNCSSDPSTLFPSAPLATSWKSPQCVLWHRAPAVTLDDTLSNPPGSIWLDNLYFRASRENAASSALMNTLEFAKRGQQLWVTNSVLQGDGGPGRGLRSEGAQVYFHDSEVRDFHAESDPVATFRPNIGVSDALSASLHFTNCDFVDNAASGVAMHGGGTQHSTVTVAGTLGIDGGGLQAGESGGVQDVLAAFKHCTWESASGSVANVVVWSDIATVDVFASPEVSITSAANPLAAPMASANLRDLPEAAEERLTSESSDELKDVKKSLETALETPSYQYSGVRVAQVLSTPGPASSPAQLPIAPLSPRPAHEVVPYTEPLGFSPQSAPRAADNALTSPTSWVVLGGAAVVVAVLVGLAAFVLRCVYRRRQQRCATNKACMRSTSVTSGSERLGGEKGAGDVVKKTCPRNPSLSSPEISSSVDNSQLMCNGHIDPRRCRTKSSSTSPPDWEALTTLSTWASASTLTPRPPPSPNRAASPVEALESALDRMFDAGEAFMDRYALLSPLHRRGGGQGVVQFVQHERGAYAIKFFLSSSAFHREVRMYSDRALQALLVPLTFASENDDGKVASSNGYAFPPFAIMERGESLNEWVSRVAPDLPTSLFVLLHVAERLQQLHATGYCHRDVKPANILWRPRANAWVLVDFGCAAVSGVDADLSFSLQYAPPEVVLAFEAGERTLKAEPSVDMWALGVIAYELLSKSRLFALPCNRSEVYDGLAGRSLLPWEDNKVADERLPMLRGLKRSVLMCLDRDPARRPSSRSLLGAWNGLFESMTGTTRDKYSVELQTLSDP